ncbi:MAG: hypothetical protein QXT14_08915 [Candidatus Bathyarchaeia archaeon]
MNLEEFLNKMAELASRDWNRFNENFKYANIGVCFVLSKSVVEARYLHNYIKKLAYEGLLLILARSWFLNKEGEDTKELYNIVKKGIESKVITEKDIDELFEYFIRGY